MQHEAARDKDRTACRCMHAWLGSAPLEGSRLLAAHSPSSKPATIILRWKVGAEEAGPPAGDVAAPLAGTRWR